MSHTQNIGTFPQATPSNTKSLGNEGSYEDGFDSAYESGNPYGDQYCSGGPSYSVGSQGEVSDVELSEEDWESMMDEEASADPEQLRSEIQKLLAEVEASELSFEQKKESLQALIKARSSADLGKWEEAVQLYEEAKYGFEGLVQQSKEEQDEKRQEMSMTLENLTQQLEKSGLSSQQKDEIRERIESLRRQSKIPGFDPKLAEKEIEAIQKDLKKAELQKLFVGLSAKVPQDSPEPRLTAEFISRVNRAFDSGDWSRVEDMLRQLISGDLSEELAEMSSPWRSNGYMGGHVISQFLGVLAQNAAWNDEQNFENLLDLFPEDIRRSMILAVKSGDNKGTFGAGANLNTFVEDDADRLACQYYGNSFAVAERLEQSLKDDDIVVAQETSPTP